MKKVPFSEKLQQFADALGLTKELVIKALNKDSEVKSVEYREGSFFIETSEGPISFKLCFKGKKEEKVCGST